MMTPTLNRTPTKQETPFAAISVWVDADCDAWCRVKRAPNEPFTVDLFRSGEHVFSRACESLDMAMTVAEGLRRINATPAARASHGGSVVAPAAVPRMPQVDARVA